ncbi:PLC-like phosphodiesterase [Phyllosticta citrichinensis]|uniref:PLC-like phosphodiesterase n=1 Tax=Phyllosticta citrichinensis TaxID=1130410 RepID=A0ABR1XHW4_9PEZI
MNFKNLGRAAALLSLASAASAQTVCNNSPSLCSKSYANVTVLGAHDSPFLSDKTTGYSTSGNQFYNSTVQLDAGVRLLTAQVHNYDNDGTTEWHLCHSSCALLDAGKLSDWLRTIKEWLDSNSNDVVTLLLVNSDDASASDLNSEFRNSGITTYAYTPEDTTTPMTTWPTLHSLIANNTRLVTFVASLSDTTDAPYLLDEFTFVYENNYDNTSPSNFSCQPDRPTSLANKPTQAKDSGRLFLQNHFLYSTDGLGIESPNKAALNTTNALSGTGSLGDAMQTCAATYAAQPWGVLVDFFNVGPAIASVDRANGVDDAEGRANVSTAQMTRNSGAVGRVGVSSLALAVVALTAAWVL